MNHPVLIEVESPNGKRMIALDSIELVVEVLTTNPEYRTLIRTKTGYEFHTSSTYREIYNLVVDALTSDGAN